MSGGIGCLQRDRETSYKAAQRSQQARQKPPVLLKIRSVIGITSLLPCSTGQRNWSKKSHVRPGSRAGENRQDLSMERVSRNESRPQSEM